MERVIRESLTYRDKVNCSEVFSRLLTAKAGFGIRVIPTPPADPASLRKWINERAEHGLTEVDRRISPISSVR